MSDQAFTQRRSQFSVRREKTYTFRADPETTVYITDGYLKYQRVDPSEDGFYHLRDGLYVIKKRKKNEMGNEPSNELFIDALNVINGEPHIIFRMEFYTYGDKEKEIFRYLDEILPFNIYIPLT